MMIWLNFNMLMKYQSLKRKDRWGLVLCIKLHHHMDTVILHNHSYNYCILCVCLVLRHANVANWIWQQYLLSSVRPNKAETLDFCRTTSKLECFSASSWAPWFCLFWGFGKMNFWICKLNQIWRRNAPLMGNYFPPSTLEFHNDKICATGYSV